MRQPDRRRFLKAVKHIEQAEIPLFELEADIAVVQQVLGKRLDMALHSYELPIPDVVAWNRWLGNDMIYFAHVWRLGRREKVDAEGRIHYIDGTMKTRDSLTGMTFPDVDALRMRMEELFAAITGTGFGVVCSTVATGTTLATAVGYEDFCLATLTDLSFLEDFAAAIHDYAMRELEMYLEFPIDVVKLGTGLITNMGTLLPPEMMERLDYRFMRDQIRLAKDHGKVCMLHVDGNVEALIPLFLEMGIDILHPIEPAGGTQDIYRIKQQYGDRLALCGNIDVGGVLTNGTPEDVARDVREHVQRLGAGGGYIVASSHDLHQHIPIENIQAMRESGRAWRRSGIGMCRFEVQMIVALPAGR